MNEFVPEPYQFQMDEAVAVTSSTTLGFGNCFSVQTASGKCYNIVNFYLDNDLDGKLGLETHLANGLTWPVKIAIIGERTAVIQDERISNEHYRVRFCECCCPMDLLPLPQRLQKAREIARGTTSFSKTKTWQAPWGDVPEMIIESTTITKKG